MENTSKSEELLKNVLGCGPFQVFLVISVLLFSKMSSTFTLVFMSFGNYNPGWRCLDINNTVLGDGMDNDNFTNIKSISAGYNISTSTNESILGIKNNMNTGEYVKGECAVFDSCNTIEFNPESSTIVTEWNLLCGRTWISSIIISVQMAGVLVGSSTSGFMADAFGRKRMLFSSQIFTAILSAVAAFSVSWQMFAAMRFLLGISISFHMTLNYIYAVEFLTNKWRGIIAVMPWSPAIAAFCGITCWILKDWRQILIATAVVSTVGLVPYLWVPESMRWLEVKNKRNDFVKTVKKIAKFNCKTIENLEETKLEKLDETKQKGGNTFRETLRIFGNQYRKNTFIVAFACISTGLNCYAIGFGIKALDGNFYINLIALYIAEVLLDFVLMFVPNIFGRRKAGIMFSGFSGVCLLVAVCFHEFSSGNVSVIGTAVFVMTGLITMNCFWCVIYVFITEIYPTVIRGGATSWGSTMIRVGGILSPVLIPKDSSSFSACYSVMGVVGLVCAAMFVLLPETKGKDLKDNFEHDISVNLSTEADIEEEVLM